LFSKNKKNKKNPKGKGEEENKDNNNKNNSNEAPKAQEQQVVPQQQPPKEVEKKVDAVVAQKEPEVIAVDEPRKKGVTVEDEQEEPNLERNLSSETSTSKGRRPTKKKPANGNNEEPVKKPKPTLEEIRETIPGPVMEKVLKMKVKSAAQLNSAETGATSKLHKFSPQVPIEEALQWVADQGSIDAVIVMTDESTLHIKDAVFEEYEDMSED
jgi:hypothetical protein